jgi:MarR family transcriptional regulator for hemolysin
MEADERFMHALHGAARAWRGRFERHLKAGGLTAAGWNALAAVVHADAALSQRELALRLGVDGATLVATIDRLAGAGLVGREAAPHDRRVKLVVPTARGRQLARQLGDEAATLRALTLDRVDANRIAAATDLLEELRHFLENT